MAITNFIETVWSEKLLTELGQRYVAAANSNREFEGDIKNVGDKVKICGVGPVSVFNYNKNTNLSSPQALTDNATVLEINRAKAFNFQIDDVDLAQSNPNLMAAAMSNAANALASEADRYIFSLWEEASDNIDYSTADGSFVNTIIDAVTLIRENTGDAKCELVCEIPPKVAAILIKEKIDFATDNHDVLDAGYIGSIAGCKVFISKNISIFEDTYKCFVRTKRAIAYAEQLSEVDAYRPELRFADAVKGLHLYGAKVIYPDEFVTISAAII